MARKKSRRPRQYLSGAAEEAHHDRGGTFEAGDRVRVSPWKHGDPAEEGVVERLTRGNFGRGRVYAEVRLDGGRLTTVPLGRLKRVKGAD